MTASSRPLLQQIKRFTGAGLLSSVGHYGLLIALVQLFAIGPVAAASAGAAFGAWINYRTNRQFTFRSRASHQSAVPRFALVAGSGIALNAMLMWLGVDLLHLNYLFSQIVTTGLLFVGNFVAHKFWTFRQQPSLQ